MRGPARGEAPSHDAGAPSGAEQRGHPDTPHFSRPARRAGAAFTALDAAFTPLNAALTALNAPFTLP